MHSQVCNKYLSNKLLKVDKGWGYLKKCSYTIRQGRDWNQISWQALATYYFWKSSQLFFQSVSKKGIVTLKRGLLLLETINSLFA